MSDRTPIIAGNWKMYKTNVEAAAYLDDFLGLGADAGNGEVILCPSFTVLSEVRRLTSGSKVRVAAQNMHFENSGAFTGEISPLMLKELGCRYVILGHSDRRETGESDSLVNKKIISALKNGLNPILCIGETHGQRIKDDCPIW